MHVHLIYKGYAKTVNAQSKIAKVKLAMNYQAENPSSRFPRPRIAQPVFAVEGRDFIFTFNAKSKSCADMLLEELRYTLRELQAPKGHYIPVTVYKNAGIVEVGRAKAAK
jgi:hypothetical protein